MGRHSCCLKQKLRKGLWSPEEDEKLFNHITRFGIGCWSSVPKQAGNISILHQLGNIFFKWYLNSYQSFWYSNNLNCFGYFLQDCKGVERVAGCDG